MNHKHSLQNNRIMDGINGQMSKAKKSNLLKNKKLLFAGAGALVVLVAIIVVLVLFIPKNKPADSDVDTSGTYTAGNSITEEEKATTKKVMDEYAEVNVVGFEEFEDENGKHNSITVNVKNISDKKISLAIDVVAKNKEGTILDKSSLYAEGIAPEQVQVFRTFVYSALSADELKAADYEVFKAYTYVAPGDSENADVQETTEPAQPEQPQPEAQQEVEQAAQPENNPEAQTEPENQPANEEQESVTGE